MSVVNRRNAVVGWLVWEMSKSVARRKARSAVPSFDLEARRPNKTLVAIGLASAGAVAYLWFRNGSGDEAAYN